MGGLLHSLAAAVLVRPGCTGLRSSLHVPDPACPGPSLALSCGVGVVHNSQLVWHSIARRRRERDCSWTSCVASVKAGCAQPTAWQLVTLSWRSWRSLLPAQLCAPVKACLKHNTVACLYGSCGVLSFHGHGSQQGDKCSCAYLRPCVVCHCGFAAS